MKYTPILISLISWVIVSWFINIPFVSKFTRKYKPKTIKPELILLLGFVGGVLAEVKRENENAQSSAVWPIWWGGRLITTLTFGFIKF